MLFPHPYRMNARVTFHLLWYISDYRVWGRFLQCSTNSNLCNLYHVNSFLICIYMYIQSNMFICISEICRIYPCQSSLYTHFIHIQCSSGGSSSLFQISLPSGWYAVVYMSISCSSKLPLKVELFTC